MKPGYTSDVKISQMNPSERSGKVLEQPVIEYASCCIEFNITYYRRIRSIKCFARFKLSYDHLCAVGYTVSIILYTVHQSCVDINKRALFLGVTWSNGGEQGETLLFYS